MKIWFLVGFLEGVTIVFLTGGQAVYSQDKPDSVIDSFIAKQAKIERAEEYTEARNVLRGDINNDRKSDAVVLYSLEGFNGSNDYIQYLAVFLADGKTFRLAAKTAVGGKLRRDVTLTSTAGGTINLDTMEYRPRDPACCPSRKSKARYVFRNGKLRELR